MNHIEPIVVVPFGSHLYHLNTPASDIDRKGIYLPTAREIVLGKVKKSYNYNKGNDKNTAGQDDYEVYSLCHFVRMAIKGETVAIDMLHAENTLKVNSPVWNYMKENRKMFYSKNMNSFMGYLRKQFMKYGFKGDKLNDLSNLMDVTANCNMSVIISDCAQVLPNTKYCKWVQHKNRGTGMMEAFYQVNDKLIQSNMPLSMVFGVAESIYNTYGKRAKQAQDNDGSDWKAISHAVRVAQQLLDIYKYGDYEYPLANTDLLLDIKLGKADYIDVVSGMDAMLLEIEKASLHSNLPEKSDGGFWEEFLYDHYSQIVFDDSMWGGNEYD